MSAMRKFPRNRYATMQDFPEDLERLSGDRNGAVVGPHRSGTTCTKPKRRSRKHRDDPEKKAGIAS
jgi:hypothetical protein